MLNSPPLANQSLATTFLRWKPPILLNNEFKLELKTLDKQTDQTHIEHASLSPLANGPCSPKITIDLPKMLLNPLNGRFASVKIFRL